MHHHPTETCEELSTYLLPERHRCKPGSRSGRFNEVVGPWSYRAKTGRGIIRLSSVEYRILQFLASQPYRAFSRRRIAEAVSTASHPVPVERLSVYIHSLRRQLGFYGDLIQSVPYIGYRFKA